MIVRLLACALALTLLATPALGGPFTTVTGALGGVGFPVGIQDIPFVSPPPGANGDFNAAPNVIQFHYGAGGFEMSGSVISPLTLPGVIAAMRLTGPPDVPPDPVFDPAGLGAGAAYFSGGSGSVTMSDRFQPVNVFGAATVLHGAAGFVYFDRPGSYVSITIESQTPAGWWQNGFNVQAGNTAGNVPFAVVWQSPAGVMYNPPSMITPSITATFGYTFFNGLGAVYLPNSWDVEVRMTPEPSAILLACGGLTLLGLARRYRRH